MGGPDLRQAAVPGSPTPPTPRPADAAVTSGARGPRCWAEAGARRGDGGWGGSRDPGPKLPPLLSRWQDGAAPGGAGRAEPRGEAGRGASTEAHSGHPGGRERCRGKVLGMEINPQGWGIRASVVGVDICGGVGVSATLWHSQFSIIKC